MQVCTRVCLDNYYNVPFSLLILWIHIIHIHHCCLLWPGEDFIMWLKRRLSVSEEEAQHLACLFCQYGYIFPVTDTKVLTVKDDNSLYRFQVSSKVIHLLDRRTWVSGKVSTEHRNKAILSVQCTYWMNHLAFSHGMWHLPSISVKNCSNLL